MNFSDIKEVFRAAWTAAPAALSTGKAEAGFAADADRAMLEQEPLRAKLVLRLFWITFAIALIWAALTNMDEITRGDAKVIPSKHLQVLQSLDGGVVSDIRVKEGQMVEAGQILVTIDPTRFDSSVQENKAQYLALVARAARLRALADDKPFVAPAEVQAQTPGTVETEQRSYDASKSTLSAQLSIAEQQLAQRRQELAEAQARRDAAARSYQLTSQELGYTRPLLANGAVSEVDVLRLERDAARFLGDRDAGAAQVSKTQAGIGEASRKIQEITLTFRSDIRKELSETMARLNMSSAGGVGLADKVDKSTLRSPMKGTVNRLLVNTVGGVVQPGKDIVEIVPAEESLLLDAKVPAKDIAFIKPGDKAVVKFTAYDFSIYGGLDAKVDVVGADSFTDERGNTFYVIRLRTNQSHLGHGLPIIPGMVAEVNILTGKKSLLSYLLKPVLRAKEAAFRER